MEEYSTKLLLNQGAYWSSSKWNCKSCKYSYDGPGMITHLRLSHKQLQTQEEVISELKDEGRLPRQYKTNYSDISKILVREIIDRKIIQHMMRQMPDVILYDDDKRNEEIRKAIKDIIASSFDIRQFEKEQVRNSKKHDWESLEYR